MVSLVASDSITGEYLMVLTQGAEYALYINKKGYLFKSYNFNYSEVKDFKPIIIDIDLERATAGSMAVLNNIFFDLDKYDLKPKSIPELQKIIRFMQENPQIRVEVSGHTDNIGQPAYNKQLSEKRALSVYNYLIEKGIDKNRLVPIGYGQAKPLADNAHRRGEATKPKNRVQDRKIALFSFKKIDFNPIWGILLVCFLLIFVVNGFLQLTFYLKFGPSLLRNH